MNEPDPPPAAFRRNLLLAGALLGLAAVAAYHGTFAVPFLFDDKTAITDNPTIRQLWPLTPALSPPNDGSGVTGRPLVNLSLALNHALSGEAVWSYHALNLLIHLGAGLALFGLVRRILRQPAVPERLRADALPVGFTVAALWLVHPLLTESVTSIIQRTESLMGLCYLFTLYGFIRGVQSVRPAGWLGLSVATCLLGMTAKEVMVSAPLVVFLADRTFVAGTFREAWRQRWRYYLGLAGTWLALGWLVLHAGGSRGEAAGFGLGVTPWTYALTQCQAILLYLKLSVWPHPLVFDYGTDVVRHLGDVWWQAVLLLLLLVGTGWALVRRPITGFLGACFFLILAPSSSVVPLVSQTMAEHRMYLPLAAVLTLGVTAAYARTGRAALGAALVVVAGFAALSIERNRDYRSELALWTDTVAKVPGSARAHLDLSEILINAGQPAAALIHAAEAVRLHPNSAEAQNNVGIALMQLGRTADAIGYCREALRLRPDYAKAHSNLGIALLKSGQLPAAITEFEVALRLEPGLSDTPVLRRNLGIALLKSGRLPEAIAQFEAVLQADPNSVEAHYSLALALGLSDRVAEAAEHLEAVLRLKPDHAAARAALDALPADRRP